MLRDSNVLYGPNALCGPSGWYMSSGGYDWIGPYEQSESSRVCCEMLVSIRTLVQTTSSSRIRIRSG
jgi:hypothetical protein